MGKPIGDKGLKLVQEFEGCYLNAYKDIVGVWTIGYGHTGKVNGKAIASGMKITKEQASELLRADLQEHANYVDNPSFCPVTKSLNANQRDALISFCFNVGPGNLKKLCTGRTVSQIADGILNYDHAGGKVVKGLTRRRQAERALYLTKVATVTTTEIKKEKSYNYDGKTYKTYTKSLFIKDLQTYFDCRTINGKFTDELYNKTITLSKSSNSKKGIIKFLQKYLKNLGYYQGDITKIFDANMEKTVKKYQQEKKLTSDGIITAKNATWKSLLK